MNYRRPVSVKETEFLCKHDSEGFNRPPSKDGKCSQALGVLFFICFLLSGCDVCFAKEIPFTDENCIRACIGEASSQGYMGLLAVSCGIRNRGTLQGVYGLNAKHVDSEPKWVWDMARKAWEASLNNRIHPGTNWENIKSFGKPYWTKNMQEVYRWKNHVFYKTKGE